MKNINIFFLFLLCFNLTNLLNVYATDSIRTNKKDNYYLIEKRIKELNKQTPVDLIFNDQVFDYINKYLEKDKKLISKMLAYSEYYFPMMDAMLDKHGLPLELKYLSIVESGLNPKARSVSGAVGLWQFMYLTGKQYNLSVSSYMDERQDPFKSTESACIYFKKLYESFGDWSLVLAAYNGGPGYIQRKIIDTEINDYWNLQQHLRQKMLPIIIRDINTSIQGWRNDPDRQIREAFGNKEINMSVRKSRKTRKHVSMYPFMSLLILFLFFTLFAYVQIYRDP